MATEMGRGAAGGTGGGRPGGGPGHGGRRCSWASACPLGAPVVLSQIHALEFSRNQGRRSRDFTTAMRLSTVGPGIGKSLLRVLPRGEVFHAQWTGAITLGDIVDRGSRSWHGRVDDVIRALGL